MPGSSAGKSLVLRVTRRPLGPTGVVLSQVFGYRATDRLGTRHAFTAAPLIQRFDLFGWKLDDRPHASSHYVIR